MEGVKFSEIPLLADPSSDEYQKLPHSQRAISKECAYMLWEQMLGYLQINLMK